MVSVVYFGGAQPQVWHFVWDSDARMALRSTCDAGRHPVWLLSVAPGHRLPLNPGTSASPCAGVSYLGVPAVL